MMTRKRLFGGLLAAAFLVTATVGGLHATTRGRALLGLGGCPFDPASKPASPEALESFRTKSLASLRTGGTRAPARPALGFVLGTTGRAEVVAWGAAKGLACAEELGGAALRCEGAAARFEDETTPSRVRDAYFRFAPGGGSTPGGALVAVDVVHEGAGPDAALGVARRLVASTERALGVQMRTVGDANAASLSAGRASRAAYELRFDDYAVDVSVTNLADPDTPPGREIVVREQYRHLAELPNR